MKDITRRSIYIVFLLSLASCASTSEKTHPGLFPLKLSNDQYGYIDTNGKIVIPAQFTYAGEFSDGLAAAKIGEKYGYIDTTGQFVIDPRFDYAATFSEGFARIGSKTGVDTRYGFVNTKGNVVVDTKYTFAYPFSDGLAAVRLVDKYGFIDGFGREVIASKFDNAVRFSEGLAAVKVGDLYGYIDKSGSFTIQPKFSSAGAFSDGLAATSEGYVDKTGQAIIPLNTDATDRPRLTAGQEFSEGMAAVLWVGHPGGPQVVFITKQSEIKTIQGGHLKNDDVKVTQIEPLSNGLAAVKINDKWGYADSRGSLVIAPKFDSAGPFKSVFALVTIGKTEMYIDREGREVNPRLPN